MATYFDPRTLSVGDTLIIRDCDGECRIPVEKVEFVAKNDRGSRYVEVTVSGGRRAHRMTGSGTSKANFRPDGTCSVYQTGGGLSLEVVRKVG